jgi:hypothetical protein
MMLTSTQRPNSEQWRIVGVRMFHSAQQPRDQNGPAIESGHLAGIEIVGHSWLGFQHAEQLRES